jgi:hypothetical protein
LILKIHGELLCILWSNGSHNQKQKAAKDSIFIAGEKMIGRFCINPKLI